MSKQSENQPLEKPGKLYETLYVVEKSLNQPVVLAAGNRSLSLNSVATTLAGIRTEHELAGYVTNVTVQLMPRRQGRR